MFTQFFFVEGSLLGKADRQLVRVHETLRAPSSYAFFCPRCADLWARCPVEQQSSKVWQPFQVLSRDCWKCRKEQPLQCLWSGSLWLDWDAAFTDAFPREVLLRELELHYKLLQERGLI